MLSRLFRRFRAPTPGPLETLHLPGELTWRQPKDFPQVPMGRLIEAEGAVIAYPGPVEPQTVTRGAALFHDDPDGFGPLDDSGRAYLVKPPPFIVSARDVRLIGRRTYVTPDAMVFNDEIHLGTDEEHFLRLLAANHMDERPGLAGTDTPGRFRVPDPERRVVHLPGLTLSLATVEWFGYGSWLYRLLPKLAEPGFADMARVLTPPLIPQTRELLKLAGVDEARIVMQREGIAYALEHAIIPSVRCTHGLIDDATRALFGRLREKVGEPQRGRRLFISRRGWAPFGRIIRPLLNEAEVETALEALDFRTIRPHEMTMREQIAAFASAEIVVGAAGSALYNTVFCHPGTMVVDIESEPHWMFRHLNLFASCGLRYGIFQAKTEDRDWSRPFKALTVNVPALLDRLRKVL